MRFSFIRWRALALSGLLLALGAPPALADDPLRIGRNAGPSAVLADIGVLVVKAAYDKLGVAVKFEPYPLLRSLALADAGSIDGDVMRVAEAGSQYPNLLRVDVPINYFEITAYARTPCMTLGGWSDLRGRRISYERGVLAIERRLKGMDTVAADNMSELFRLLERGMVDVAVGTGLETDLVWRGLKDERLCKVSGTLERVPLFHFLHKRHAALVLRLQAELLAMQKRGEIDAILRREGKRLTGQ